MHRASTKKRRMYRFSSSILDVIPHILVSLVFSCFSTEKRCLPMTIHRHPTRLKTCNQINSHALASSLFESFPYRCHGITRENIRDKARRRETMRCIYRHADGRKTMTSSAPSYALRIRSTLRKVATRSKRDQFQGSYGPGRGPFSATSSIA